MAFDLFVHCHREDGDETYPKAIVEAIFNRGAINSFDGHFIRYPDGRGEVYFGGDSDRTDGFMLTHFRGDMICERVLEIAATTRSVIYWPGSTILMAATSHDIIANLPLDIRASAGEIALVSSVDELWEAINRGE